MALSGLFSCKGASAPNLDGKKLVVYYSWGGNTKAVAEYIAEKTGADILEIKTQYPYPTDYDECVRKVGQEGKNYETELDMDVPDLNQYDVVFVGSPCWWGTIANPLRSFLHQNDLSGKTVVPFMTHGTSGLHVGDVKMLCPNSNVAEGLGIFNRYQVETTVNTPDNMGDYTAEVDQWLNEMGAIKQ